jgi:hypothetical protein
MANIVYNKFKDELAGAFDWTSTGTIKAALVSSTSTYTPDPDTTSMGTGGIFDTATWEPNGTGYTRGFASSDRKTLASRTKTNDTANNRTELTCTSPFTWAGLDVGIIKAIVIYYHDTSDNVSWPILWIDQPSGAGGFPFTSNGGSFSFTINAEGLIQLT